LDALIKSLHFVARAGVAMLCIILACARARAAEGVPPTVGVDFSTLDAGTHRDIDGLALEKATVLRLVQEGFPVVGASASPVVLVSLRRVPDGLLIEARGRSTVRSVLPLQKGSSAEFQLMVVQRIVDAARASEQSERPADTERASADGAQQRAEAPEDAIRSKDRATRRGEIEIEVGGGAVWRGSAPDLLARAGIRYAVTRRIGGGGALAFTPSTEPGIDVREWQAEIGTDYRLVDAAPLHVDAGIAFGLALQHFQLSDPAAEEREGVFVDAVARLPFTVSYSGRHFGLAAWVAPGVASRHHRHVLNSEVLWDRGPGRVDSGVAVLWRW
jgi:hypothetical protein